jgi:hypothetical protein
MTISSTTTVNQYTGNNSTTAFAYAFKIYADADLKVILTSTAGVETVQTLSTHYTVSGAGDAGGGNVTFTSGNTPGTGVLVTILRNTAITQSTDYVANDAFPAALHEDALDRLTVISQHQQDRIDRSIKAPDSEAAGYNMTLPAKASRLGKVLGFNSSTGNPEAVDNGALSNAEVRAAVEAASDSNVFTDADHSKLDGIAASANNYSHPNHTGDVTSSADGATTIAADAVTGAKIADDAVDSEHIASGAIDLAHMSANSVDSDQYVDGSIDTAHIGDDQVTYAKIQNVSATNVVLGRDSSGAGVIEEISASSLRTILNVEDGATADQSNAEIRAAVEAATDSNVFTDADHSKLNAIEASADVTDTANVVAALTAGTNVTIASDGTIAATSGGDTNQNAFSNVAVSGQSTVAADAATDTLTLAAGSNVTLTTDAGTDTVTIASTDTNTTYSVGDGGLTQNNFTNTLKSKLDGIEASATADQTDAEIRAAVEAATDSNVFTDADHSKLNAIEASATADQSASEIEAIVNHDNLQGFVAAEHVDWTADQGSTNIHSGNYTNTTYSVGDGGLTQNNFTNTLKSKLDGIEASATADQSASEILTAVKTVDGASSGLDADLLDGQHGSYYTNYADTAVSNLVDSSPSALNTLNELAAALGDDANFSTTVTNSIATKMPLAGGTFTGDVTFVDGENAIFGTGQDFFINHNTDALITNLTNSIYIQNYANDKDVIIKTDDGSGGITDYFKADGSTGEVQIYHYGSEKLKSQAGGVDVTGDITVSGTVDGRDIATNIPASLGTAGQVLTVNSGASAAEWAAASGGFTLIKENYSNDTAPNVTGNDSVGIGGSVVVSAGDSVAMGYLAKVEGAMSVAIGVQAHVTTGATQAIAIGDNAKVNAGTSGVALGTSFVEATDAFAAVIGTNSSTYGAKAANAIALGDLAKASHANAIVLGDTAASSAANEITLGSTSDTVRISSVYTLPTADGSANQVLTAAGDGSTSWAAASGGGGSPDLYAENYTTGTKPTTTGTNAVSIGKGSSAAGTEAIAMVDGTADSQDSFAVGGIVQSAIGGYAIGKSAQVYSQYGLALGQSALVSAASYGTAVGYQSVAGANSAVAFAKSRASGADSLAGAIASNSSSYGATASGAAAIMNWAKASSSNSGAFGFGANATNSMAYAFGAQTFATGDSSVSLGRNSLASATYSICIGNAGQNNIQSSIKFSGSQHANQGDAQIGLYPLMADTTDATATAMVTNHQSTPSAGTANQIVLPNNSAYAFHGTIVARQKAGDGTACAAWKIEGLIRREANAGTTTLVSSTVTAISNTPSWGLALSADTTNGCLKVQATGAASTNIRWTTSITTSELTYA